jgi:hypothetical protein
LGLHLVWNERGETRGEQDGEQYFFHRLVLNSTRAVCAYSFIAHNIRRMRFGRSRLPMNPGDKTNESR